MIAAATTSVDPRLSPLWPRNVLVIWGGTNDMNAGATGAATYANLVAYCNARRAAAGAAGLKIVVLTTIARTLTAISDAQFEIDRLAYNALIRANYATFADALVDIATDTHFDAPADTNDTTYYVDKTHLTVAGYAIVAAAVKVALASLAP
jgi:lysophospholipase L1-like esterase